MSAPLLIGLSGKKRRGKDTLGLLLTEQHAFTRFGFADALKSACLDINSVVVHNNGKDWSRLQEVFTKYGSFEAIKKSPWDVSVRDLLQQVGSVMALRDNGIWAAPVVRDAAFHVAQTGKGAVITDVRFPWEADMIRSAGGVMVRVFRSDMPDNTDTDSHISETMLDAMIPDAYLDTTPLQALPEKVNVLLGELMYNRVAAI